MCGTILSSHACRRQSQKLEPGARIVQLPYQAETRAALVADLVERGEVERLPQKRMIELSAGWFRPSS